MRDELTVHGRKESGRGVDGSGGKYYEYEAHNIHYKVCEDYNGIFDGSDECAAKAWGKDRAVSLEYYKIHFPQLNLPLVATIDFGGFRVLATSILPTERATFNDEGELRKLTEDFVHGVQNYGESFANRSKAFSQSKPTYPSTFDSQTKHQSSLISRAFARRFFYYRSYEENGEYSEPGGALGPSRNRHRPDCGLLLVRD